MPKNLEEKIKILLDDLETLPRSEAVRKIKNLIEEELKFIESTHEINNWDLNNVRSHAKQQLLDTDLSIHGRWANENLDEFRAWCYVDAVVTLLKGKGLIPFDVIYSRDKK